MVSKLGETLEGDGSFDVNFVNPEDDPTKKAPK